MRKKCRTCGKLRNPSSFTTKEGGRNVNRNECKFCVKERSKKSYKAYMSIQKNREKRNKDMKKHRNPVKRKLEEGLCMVRQCRQKAEEVGGLCLMHQQDKLAGIDLPLVTEPTQKQVGGDHYASQKIQPIDYIQANNLGFEEGNIVKYITRHKLKNGREDVEKALHYCELLLRRYDD